MIRFKNLTKHYGKYRGIEDISVEVPDGQIFGCLGPEKSGKTTLLLLLMGFLTPTRGWCSINGKNCRDRQKELVREVGYLPQRPAFPPMLTGMQFLRSQATMREVGSMECALTAADRLELNLEEKISRLIPSEKQCLGIAAALLHNPSILLLDEPMKHLEPLQRQAFREMLMEAKEKEKTVFWTSGKFEEMETICDRVGMLKKGCLINVESIDTVRKEKRKTYLVTFESEQEAFRFVQEKVEIRHISANQVTVSMEGELLPLLQILCHYKVVGLEGMIQPLEETFIHFYGGTYHA